MGVEPNPICSLLDQIGASVDEVQSFEGNKFLVRVDGSTRSVPDFFFKPVGKLDPLSREILELRSTSFGESRLSGLEKVAILPIGRDSDSGYVAYPYFHDALPLKAVLADAGADRFDLITQVAATLAGFHVEAARLLHRQALETSDIHTLWPDLLEPTIAEFSSGPGADYPLLIRYLQTFEGVAEAIESFRAGPFEPAVCHGDFKFDNVLVREGGLEVRIIDISDLILYDRHYDLGVAAAELLSLWLAKIDYSDVDQIAEALDRTEGEFQAELGLLKAFLRAYWAETDMTVCGQKLAYFAGRGLIHNALGSLYLANHLSRYHWACLHVGANLVANFLGLGEMFVPDVDR